MDNFSDRIAKAIFDFQEKNDGEHPTTIKVSPKLINKLVRDGLTRNTVKLDTISKPYEDQKLYGFNIQIDKNVDEFELVK